MKPLKAHRRPAHILALESSRAASSPHTVVMQTGGANPTRLIDPRYSQVIQYRDAGTWLTGNYTPFTRVEIVTTVGLGGQVFTYTMAMI
jgi:hypothetical protein